MPVARRKFLEMSVGAGAAIVSSPVVLRSSYAKPVVLRLQHHEPAQGTIPSHFLAPWAKKIETQSGGQIKIEFYPSQQLGGTPGQNYSLVRDGVIDMTWTVPGYTPGRFPRSEVFELPFIAGNGEQNSGATWELYEKHLHVEYNDVKLLVMHTNGPYLIHAKGKGVRRLEDMKGLKVRGATRLMNKLIEALGGTPVGMPIPAVPDALSKGVIDAAVMPWEITRAFRIAELVQTHTSMSGNRSLCVGVFVVVMNKNRYESLPADLKKVIDSNSGLEASRWAGKVMDDGDLPGYEIAKKRGNAIIVLDAAETARWKKAAEPVVGGWIAEMKAKGINGAQLVAEVRALITKYAGAPT
jgi:TRAP-type C4-dicarboxylate transport system substrate-binding protein